MAMCCPQRDTDNREGRKFCTSCGSQLAAVCSTCGVANLPGEQFCGECGTALTVPTAAETAALAKRARRVRENGGI